MNSSKKMQIAVAGNPNCGKTTIFNALTGVKQKVGNWPGVTVERKVGEYSFAGQEFEVVDLPGIYSLSTSSLDEQVARDYILNDNPDLIVNVIDASNLERNMYLTVQLIEMNVPMVVVINMMDVLQRKEMRIDVAKLEQVLGVPVIAAVAHKNEGIAEIKNKISQFKEGAYLSTAKVEFPDEVESAISEVEMFLAKYDSESVYDSRWFALKLLENDISHKGIAAEEELLSILQTKQRFVEKILGDEMDIVIADSRYGFINSVSKTVLDRSNVVRKHVSDLVDGIVLNRFLGIPLFLAAMYFTFWITINLGGCFIDFFDGIFGTVFVDGVSVLMQSFNAPDFLTNLIANGIGGALQTVATFIPPIFFMFFCLAILEDSGYMARAAFVMDRMMKVIGLPGKAFVPILVGFGCNVPAIMATRTLESEKDRVLTIMMNPFMSCGARMPVYALFAAAFFPESGSNIVFALYIIGIMLALMTALIFKSTILKGEASSFIMELPAYHIPTMRGIFFHTYERLKSFIFRAGKAILLVVIILNFFNSLGTDGSFGNEDTDKSVLSSIGRGIVPIFKPMGMTDKNWPAAVGIFTGIFAKEAVVGTLATLYAPAMEESGAEGEEEFDFWGGIGEAFATVPDALADLSLPFSVSGLLGAEVDGAIDELEVEDDTYAEIKKRFDGKTGAFAYLLMILLYMPCVAAIAAVYRELNFGWTLFASVYLSALAWLSSTLFYQLMTFVRHPASSLFWISVVVVVFVGFIFGLKKRGAVFS